MLSNPLTNGPQKDETYISATNLSKISFDAWKRYSLGLDVPPPKQIYCDLDEVLSDFIGGANKLLYSIDLGPITPQKDSYTPADYELRLKQFDAIRSVKGFYENLPWTSDGQDLWAFIRKFDPIVLTSRSELVPDCDDQKKAWIKRELGPRCKSNCMQ